MTTANGFPHSVILCGVREYHVHSGSENRMVLGGSAFNVKSKSLRLGDFSAAEMLRRLRGRRRNRTAVD